MDSKEKEINKEPIAEVIDMDHILFKRLDNCSYWGLVEEWDTLMVRFYHGEILDSQEARRLKLLVKYFEKNGHSESMQIRCKHFIDKYLQGW